MPPENGIAIKKVGAAIAKDDCMVAIRPVGAGCCSVNNDRRVRPRVYAAPPIEGRVEVEGVANTLRTATPGRETSGLPAIVLDSWRDV